MRVNLVSWLAGSLGFALVVYQTRGEPWPATRVAGLVICFVAWTLVSMARYQLGSSFSVSARAQHLVTTGLYSRLRNPIYVFAELFLAGAALFFRSWWPVVILMAAIPLQVIRARREAAVLEAAFGEEYVAYRRRTWF